MAGRLLDLRRDNRAEYELYGNIGRAIGGGMAQFSLGMERKRREELRRAKEQEIVRITSNAAATNEDPYITRQKLIDAGISYDRSYQVMQQNYNLSRMNQQNQQQNQPFARQTKELTYIDKIQGNLQKAREAQIVYNANTPEKKRDPKVTERMERNINIWQTQYDEAMKSLYPTVETQAEVGDIQPTEETITPSSVPSIQKRNIGDFDYKYQNAGNWGGGYVPIAKTQEQTTQEPFVGPPAPMNTFFKGKGYQTSGFVQPVTQTAFRNKADAAIEKEIAPESEMTGKIEDVFGQYKSKMDAESWSELMQIMSTGDTNKLNIALKRLRERYGYIR